ncbi:hypothetical protein J3F83DRAFT_738887 [Trichoderma novae-zelandiae]
MRRPCLFFVFGGASAAHSPGPEVSRASPHLDNRAPTGFAIMIVDRGERRHLRPDNQPPPRASRPSQLGF